MHASTILSLVSLAVTASPGEDTNDWSFGAGVGTGSAQIVSTGVGGLGAIGVLGSPLATYRVGVERRLSDALWMRALGGFGHRRMSFEGEDTLSHLSWNADLGLRYAFLRTGPVELSTLAGAFVLGSRSSAQLSQSVLRGGIDLGFAVDYALLDSLYLRLASKVASASIGQFEFESDDGTAITTQSGTEIAADLEVAPSIELRMTF